MKKSVFNWIFTCLVRKVHCRKCGRLLTKKSERHMGISLHCLKKEAKHEAEQIMNTKPYTPPIGATLEDILDDEA